MVFEIVQNNYACLILCILFIIFILTDRSFDRNVEWLFLSSVILVLCLTLVDNLELVEAQKSVPTMARKVYSAIGYALRPGTAVMIIFIMYRNMNERRDKIIKRSLLLILYIVNAVLAFVSIFNGCMFQYTSDNQFVRGTFGYMPFITAGVYVLSMMTLTAVSLRKRQRLESIVLFTIGGMCVGGCLMEAIWSFDGTLNTACAIGTLFYYLYLHVSIYSNDQLTNVFNRRIFVLDIQKLNKSNAIIIGIDLNNLKQLNDSNGHAEGDLALQTLAGVIQKNLYRHCELYRVGGDEFMILCKKIDLNTAEKMMQKITREMDKTPYSFAYGCAKYKRGDNIKNVCDEADGRMYQMKEFMKVQASMEETFSFH